MLEIRVAYKLPEGGGGGGLGDLGGLGGGGAGLLLGALVLVAVAAAAESKLPGARMVIDGCRDCGTFWFDASEMRIVKQSTSVEGEDEKIGRLETDRDVRLKAARESVRLSVGRSENTNCLHIDEKIGKKCRRVTFRHSEYCYKHQPK